LAANSNGYDLILLDINLGSDEMDGCDVLRCLRQTESYKKKPIFAITAYALPQDKERFLKEGFDEYFSKPVNYQKLQDKIDQIQELYGLPNSGLTGYKIGFI